MSGKYIEVIGVDPGIHGGIASYDGGDFVTVFDFPIVKSKGRGEEINVPALVEMVNETFPKATHGFIENVQARPMEGRGTVFKFGYSAGLIRGMLAVKRVPLVLTTPQEWKAAMRCTSDKDYSRKVISELFPLCARDYVRKMDMNRAEAALIAVYGYRKITGAIK